MGASIGSELVDADRMLRFFVRSSSRLDDAVEQYRQVTVEQQTVPVAPLKHEHESIAAAAQTQLAACEVRLSRWARTHYMQYI